MERAYVTPAGIEVVEREEVRADGSIGVVVIQERSLYGVIDKLLESNVQLRYGLEHQIECVNALQTKETEYLARIAELEGEVRQLKEMIQDREDTIEERSKF
jgi:hypothetical protein